MKHMKHGVMLLALLLAVMEFYDMVFKDSGTTVSMSFHDHYGSLARQRLSGLDVDILSGTDIWLNTAN